MSRSKSLFGLEVNLEKHAKNINKVNFGSFSDFICLGNTRKSAFDISIWSHTKIKEVERQRKQ